MVKRRLTGTVPGLRAPARLGLVLAMLAAAQPNAAQQPQPAGPAPAPAQAQAQPPSPVPVPDQLTALKLLWGTMAAIDQANRTGNYSVLRDLGSAAFQSGSNPTTLAAAFTPLRDQGIDLGDTLLAMPNWAQAPTMQGGQLRMTGSFPVRTAPVVFDIAFIWERGWRLHGLAVRSQGAARR